MIAEIKTRLFIALLQVDEYQYPEFYRKTARVKGSNTTTSKPFQVAIVEDIMAVDKEGEKKLRMHLPRSRLSYITTQLFFCPRQEGP